jgi:hypothetical protein
MQPKLSAKNKIIILSVAWLVISFIMLSFIFKIMDTKNQAALERMATDRQDLAILQGKSLSFKQAQSDLEKLSKEELQPTDFFSKDINLVKEIQVLEDLDAKFNTKVVFSGVSGVIGKGQLSADTASAMSLVPYTLSVNGSFQDVVKLVESFENLYFISKINGLSLSSSGEGGVNANIGSGFYVESN